MFFKARRTVGRNENMSRPFFGGENGENRNTALIITKYVLKTNRQ